MYFFSGLRNMIKRLWLTTCLAGIFFSMATGQNQWTSPLQNCWNLPFSEEIELTASDNDYFFITSPKQFRLYNSLGNFIWSTPNPNLKVLQVHFTELNILILSLDGQQNIVIQTLSKQSGLLIWSKNIPSETNPNNYPSSIFHENRFILINQNEIYYFDSAEGNLTEKLILSKTKPEKSVITIDRIYLFFRNNQVDTYTLKSPTIINHFQVPGEITHYLTFNRRILLSNSRGNIFSYQNQKQLWTTKVGGEISSSHFNQNYVAVASNDNYLYQFKQHNGKVIWKKRFSNRISTTFSSENNLLFIITNNEGILEIVNPRDGKAINQLVLNDESFSAQTKILVKEDLLIIFGQDQIRAFSPRECK